MALNIQEHYGESVSQLCVAFKYMIIAVMLSIALGILVHPAAADQIAFNETIPGDRNLGQNFTWTAYNVSMNADSVYHYTVYDYREIGDKYHYYSVNWGNWEVQNAEPGKKYFAIWIRGWLEGTAWYGWGSDRFLLWVGNKSFSAEPVQLQDLPLRNIGKPESTIAPKITCPLNTPTPSAPVISSGSTKPIQTGRYLPVVIQELEYLTSQNERGRLTTERYGWKDENEMIRMEPGESNAYNGLLLFQIPDSSRPDQMTVSGSFWSWGTAFWHLTNTTIVQDSFERIKQLENIQVKIEKENGLRLPDKEPGRSQA